jgi:P27 family predicted phage terminase small subunit
MPGANLEPPAHFDDERRAIWQETVDRLTEGGRAFRADAEVLNTYVEAVRSHRQASRLLARTNVMIVRDGKGLENPALAIQRRSADAMAKASKALGLNSTPTEPADDGNNSAQQNDMAVKPWERRTLCRELAAGDLTRTQLARKYGLNRSNITRFAQRHAREIDDIKAQLDNQYAGLWIADKANRIAAYQADLELSEADAEYGAHYEHIRTRKDILRAVAEELGQLPPRTTVVVTPVVHVLEGVNVDELK